MSAHAVAAMELLWGRRVRVFDLDGTLVDTLPDLCAALAEAMHELGLQSLPQAVLNGLVRASLHGGLQGSVQAVLAEAQASQALMQPLLTTYEACYGRRLCERSRPYDGVPEVINRLLDQGAPMAVCTNKSARQATEILEALDLLSSFQLVVGADTCTHRKPSPVPLLYAIAQLGGEPLEALLVGDSEVDRACAEAAGVPLLWHASGYGERMDTIDGVNSPAYFMRWRSLLRAPSAHLEHEHG